MKIYAILVFASLWLIHIRVANAGKSPSPYGNNFRAGNPAKQLGPYRRAHHHHTKPSHANGYRKKWYPHQSLPSLNQRPRRPPPSLMVNNYMRQRLSLGLPAHAPLSHPQLPATLPTAAPTVSSHAVQANFNLQPKPQATQQQPITRNYINKALASSSNKWSFPSRNLKPQLPQPQPLQQHPPQQKPFLSSPKIQTEVEYHIQNNLIPNQPVMIKQLDDEKGPIHTIPAPNLGPADKPKSVHIHHHQQTYETTTTRVHKSPSQSFQSHQYQVTESVDQPENPQDAEVAPQKPEAIQDEVFSLLPVQDGYAYSVLHQPQLQQHILQQQQSNAYQTMLVQPQFFRPEPSFLESQHKKMATPPEMHTFNYEEPKHGNSQIVQSHVSAEYVLQQEDDDQDSGEPLTEGFYTSLPSKEVADSFAHLHDAGRKQHVQATGQSQQQDMMIYVPDDQEQFDPAEDLEQYESSEGNGQQGEKGIRFGFGSRIRPKN